ncbi:MAG: 2-amino-4-hydroxy-6-hydroxymethyldihydropteridine diphosphokinase [Chitinophagales bacterium]|nr:2-amino-4-hydroxy-6-hydroxymethyldihydropteridine diphosphokinase [Chitinophagaceae bacterium]MCB9064942.1 2-amino-4-hydroxy-6-hydroxymethyldihydropteridine diphosphokinase [Chitinophagales bacterium]
MNIAYLLLGSNEGDRVQNLEDAIMLTARFADIKQKSPIYVTAPWGLPDQPDFLNQAIEIATDLTPMELLTHTSGVETELGRQRTIKWGQRTLDIDILFYNDLVLDNKQLTIPHPAIQDRRFALMPLNDIAASLSHPIFKKNIAELLETCLDTLEVKPYISDKQAE